MVIYNDFTNLHSQHFCLDSIRPISCEVGCHGRKLLWSVCSHTGWEMFVCLPWKNTSLDLLSKSKLDYDYFMVTFAHELNCLDTWAIIIVGNLVVSSLCRNFVVSSFCFCFLYFRATLPNSLLIPISWSLSLFSNKSFIVLGFLILQSLICFVLSFDYGETINYTMV